MKKFKTGVLLVNLGTPDSFKVSDVKSYLTEFLTDPRVIDFPWLKRNILVRGLIIPLRVKNSADTYKKVWFPEGSPLKIYSEQLIAKLKEALSEDHEIVLAMRYKSPSIEKGLQQLKDAKVHKIIVLPLFPQYASATTGSVHEKVMKIISKWQVIPEVKFISEFYEDPLMIKVFAENGAKHDPDKYDHVLFSFHGLPKRHIDKAAVNNYCRVNSKCCSNINANNQYCYRAQCHATARAIAKELNLPEVKYSVTFQSRLGKEVWLEPYTTEVIKELAQKGAKKLLVFSPAFVADCLETIYEIQEEYGLEFKHLGGEKLQLVESLNTHPLWVESLKNMILN